MSVRRRSQRGEEIREPAADNFPLYSAMTISSAETTENRLFRPRPFFAKLRGFRVSGNCRLSLDSHDSRPVAACDEVAGKLVVREKPLDPL